MCPSGPLKICLAHLQRGRAAAAQQALGLVMKSSQFSTAVSSLQWAVLRRWDELPNLRKLHREIGSIKEDARPYIRALEAIQSEYILTILAAHALCEALINCTIALTLADKGKEHLFTVLERSDFLEKWTLVPQLIVEGYEFPKASAAYETLHRMNLHRNFYLHNKPWLESEGKIIYQGSKSKKGNLQSDLDWIHRYISLPFDLSDRLRLHEEFLLPALLLDRRQVPQAPQHKA
jgi:hypothetical protein